MKRFLLLALTAGLLIPNVAKAERDEARHICASYDARDLTPKQALRKLGLKVPKDIHMANFIFIAALIKVIRFFLGLR